MSQESDVYKQLGKLEANVEAMQSDIREMKDDLKSVTTQMNKWRGAGIILLLIGAAVGWLIDLAYKLLGR
jgi:Ni2+-binding GTPase involved in maturation of urease and hydrogenase